MLTKVSEQSTVCVPSIQNIGTYCDQKGASGANKDKWGVLRNKVMKTYGSVNGGILEYLIGKLQT